MFSNWFPAIKRMRNGNSRGSIKGNNCSEDGVPFFPADQSNPSQSRGSISTLYLVGFMTGSGASSERASVFLQTDLQELPEFFNLKRSSVQV